jgi:hypothetical protein
MKEVPDTQATHEACMYAEDGASVAVIMTQVPIKYKHCHGDTTKQGKATKVHNYLRQHFTDILNKPRKVSKMKALATKFKSLFSKGSKK